MSDEELSDLRRQVIHVQLGAGGPAAPETRGGRTNPVGITMELIPHILRMTAGNHEQAAKILGIGERTLYRKIEEYRLKLAQQAAVLKQQKPAPKSRSAARIHDLAKLRQLRESVRSWIAKVPRFPRLWDLMGYVMPRKMRLTVYVPVCEDQKRDYYEARRTYRTKPARAWLTVCFCVRTVCMFLDCWRVAGLDRIGRLVALLIPERLKQWWTIR